MKELKKKKLKLWQVIALIVVASLFIAASVILCVFYKDAIFTNNALAIALLILALLVFAGAGLISWRYFKR